jgi:predicted DNA-binding transcriptional regulator YafY
LVLAESGQDEEGKERFAFFSKGRIDYRPHLQTIETLLTAIEKRLVCRLSYRALGRAEAGQRLFAPRQFVAMNGALYILGADVENDLSLRRLTNLAVHRIVSSRLTEKRHNLALPKPQAGAFGLPWHEPRSFRIRFRPGKASDYVRERVWADEQTMEEAADGGLVLSILTRSEPELTAWVRSFGPDAALLSDSDV